MKATVKATDYSVRKLAYCRGRKVEKRLRKEGWEDTSPLLYRNWKEIEGQNGLSNL